MKHQPHSLFPAVLLGALIGLCSCSGVTETTPALSVALPWQIHDTEELPELCRAITTEDEADFIDECARVMAKQPAFVNQEPLQIMKVHFAYARGAMGQGVWLGSNEQSSHALSGTGGFRYARAIWIGAQDPITRRNRYLERRSLNGTTYFADVARNVRDGRFNSDTHLHAVLQTSLGNSAGTNNLRALQGVAPRADYVAGINTYSFSPALARKIQQIGVLAIDVGSVSTNYALEVVEDEDGNEVGRRFEDGNGRFLVRYSYQFGKTTPSRINITKFEKLAVRWAQLSAPEADRTLFVVPAGNEGQCQNPAAHDCRDYYKNPFVMSTMPYLLEGLPADHEALKELPADYDYENADLPAELKKVSLTAVALGSGTELASYSNWCGVARDYCFSMPVYSLLNTPAWSQAAYAPLQEVAGTSVAAPLLMGTLAVVSSRFPELGNVEVAERLKATASLKGMVADADISVPHEKYGLGIPDLKAATEPLGETSMTLGRHIQGASFPLKQSGLTLLSGAFGDALASGFSRQFVMALDRLRTPFRYPATAFVRQQADSSLTDRQLYLSHRSHWGPWDLELQHSNSDDNMMSLAADGWQIHLGNGPSPALLTELDDILNSHSGVHPSSALATPWAAGNRHWQITAANWRGGDDHFGYRLGWMHFRGRPQSPSGESSARTSDSQYGQSLTWRMDFGHRTSLGMQLVDSLDDAELFGLKAAGGFGQLMQARSRALGFFAAHWLHHSTAAVFSVWQLAGGADFGTGALRRVRDLHATAWTAALLLKGLHGPGGGDWLLRLEQPLRMRAGWLQFDLPDSRTRYGEVLHQSLWLSAIPSGREIRLQLDYEHPISRRGGLLRMSFGHATEPWHRLDAAPASYSSFGLVLPL